MVLPICCRAEVLGRAYTKIEAEAGRRALGREDRTYQVAFLGPQAVGERIGARYVARVRVRLR